MRIDVINDACGKIRRLQAIGRKQFHSQLNHFSSLHEPKKTCKKGAGFTQNFPLIISNTRYTVCPLRKLFQIPVDRLDNARVKVFVGFPAQFGRQFGRINGITAVMSRTVGNKDD